MTNLVLLFTLGPLCMFVIWKYTPKMIDAFFNAIFGLDETD